MIPSDLAARLRLLTESLVNPVAPVHEIPAELPELPIGQRFVARIESALPDGTFRALVAGRSLTLALPQQARPGDTLALVVAARTPRLVVAGNAMDAPHPSDAPTTLSRAGQIISTLLAGEERPAQAPVLTRTAPLLPDPAPQAARLAPALQQAIVESGLFYESHQAQWIAGRYPLEALAREPQARLKPASRNALPAPAAPAAAAPSTPAPSGEEAAAPARTTASVAQPGAPLPAELQALVQQQLDAAATQHLIWRGDIWPGQALHWEIETGEYGEGAADEAAAETWTTALRLTLPQLGEVNAVLRLAAGKVSLAMTAPAAHAALLRDGLGELAAAFADAGLPTLAAQVDARG